MAKEFFTRHRDQGFLYMMLGRLISDCEYYKEHPNHKHLWAGNPEDQEAAMREVWDKLDIKPEWCTLEQLEDYINMLK